MKREAAPQLRRTVVDILHTVCEHYGVSPTEVLSDSRKRMASEARSVTYGLCRDLTRASSTELGAALNRDSTSVIHGVRSLARRMRRDWVLARSVALCREKCLETMRARRVV